MRSNLGRRAEKKTRYDAMKFVLLERFNNAVGFTNVYLHLDSTLAKLPVAK